MVGPIRKFLIGTVWFVHFLIVLAFPLGFFIPRSMWPSRVAWHFWYSVAALVMAYLWGLIWTLKFKDKVYAICFVQTFMQWLRGYPLFDERNYKRSFVSEMLGVVNLEMSGGTSTTILIICVVASGVLYFFR